MDLSLKHLQILLMRVDLLIHREVRRWQQANQDAADLLRGQYISDSEVNALLKQPFGTHWRYLAGDETATQQQAYDRALAKTAAQEQALLAEAGQNGEGIPRFLHLQRAFGLSDFERDVLLIALAPALDLRYERLYGYLLDDATRKRPSVNLALDLLCPPGPERLAKLAAFTAVAPLQKYSFLELIPEPGMMRPPLLNQAIAPNPSLLSWLLGDYQPHDELGQAAKLVQVRDGDRAEAWLMAAPRLQEMATAALGNAAQADPVLLFYGPDEAAQVAAARVLAYQAGRPLFMVDMTALVKEAQLPPERALRLALRDALLTQAIPYLAGWEACVADTAVSPDLLTQLFDFPYLLMTVSTRPWQARTMPRTRRLIRLEFPVPVYQQRLALWQHHLQQVQGQPLPDTPETAQELHKLAGQFMLHTGQIGDVVLAAQDRAVKHGRGLTIDDIFVAARDHSNPRLATLARKITPRYQWDDLVLPADPVSILREIVSTVLGRPKVLEEWGVGKKLYSSGVTVLFAGPPGTGKTMAAEVIARDLGLDLFKIDLSSVVSKYIGETEKNLERIFNEAQSSNAILFFDEADSIFGKRSEVKDAHDRYANIEVSYLLQRMENYDGVTILATNLRANLDEAFMRRLQFAVDFPFPEAQDRLRIWQTLFPPDVPRGDDLDFEFLARRFKFAGGNIRNILVSAAYLAATNGQIVRMEHLLHGTRRELQKMGRLVDEQDLKQ